MSIKNKVSDFISELQGDGENLFPYLANKDWKPGNNIYYSGPYWDEQEPYRCNHNIVEWEMVACRRTSK